ncbi:hypothetical protein HGA91_06030 [candidate division WWE3 bacterium]|nr:hypothetical protein [candidate division WWE3 bacterium]
MPQYLDRNVSPANLILSIDRNGKVKAHALYSLQGMRTLASTHRIVVMRSNDGCNHWEYLTPRQATTEEPITVDDLVECQSISELDSLMVHIGSQSLKDLWTKLMLMQNAQREVIPPRGFYASSPIKGHFLVVELTALHEYRAWLVESEQALADRTRDESSTYFILPPDDRIWRVIDANWRTPDDLPTGLPFLIRLAFGEPDLDAAMRFFNVDTVYDLWYRIYQRQEFSGRLVQC